MSDSNHVRVWAEQALRLQEELLEKEREQARRDALKWAATEMRAWAQSRNLRELHPSLWWSFDELICEIEKGQP